MKRREMLAGLAAPILAASASKFRVYLAGPLFTEAERSFLEYCAEKIRGLGAECFVPHEHELPKPADPAFVFQLDADAIRSANAMVAWVDGADVDSGTACEIGLFAQLAASDPQRYRGIAAIGTDLRQTFRKDTPGGGLNLFVAGAIRSCGAVFLNADLAVAQVRKWM